MTIELKALAYVLACLSVIAGFSLAMVVMTVDMDRKRPAVKAREIDFVSPNPDLPAEVHFTRQNP